LLKRISYLSATFSFSITWDCFGTLLANLGIYLARAWDIRKRRVVALIMAAVRKSFFIMNCDNYVPHCDCPARTAVKNKKKEKASTLEGNHP